MMNHSKRKPNQIFCDKWIDVTIRRFSIIAHARIEICCLAGYEYERE